MDDLEFIVERLSAEPFNLSIRAVEFEKPTNERLQLLFDVLSTIDKKVNVDVSADPHDSVVDRLHQFLALHKYEVLPSNECELEEWIDGIINGQTAVKIFHWLLTNYERLKKRCYLEPYLRPIEVPHEYLYSSDSNSNLIQLLETHRDLQVDFMETHKEYESAISSGISGVELERDIMQLVKEKQILLERLRHEQNQARNPEFEQETRRLRLGQDEEKRLQQQKRDQLLVLSTAQHRLEQVQHVLQNLPELHSSEAIKFIIDYQSKIIYRELERAQVEENCDYSNEMDAAVADLEDKLERKLTELEENCSPSFSLDKLKTFQQASRLLFPPCLIGISYHQLLKYYIPS